jgi:FtsP/CotA-like multicopper oxidase with cupredoxin domain
MFALLLAACTMAPVDTATCGTPDDADATADITLTAQDAALEPVSGQPFYAWTYDGDVPGPILRIPLGETRTIKLVNDSPRDASLHFHGVTYTDDDDGSLEHPDSVVAPGCSHVYTVTANAPGVWPYHSHVHTRTDMDMGLVGAIIVPDPAETPADHEFVAVLSNLGVEMEGMEGEEGDDDEEMDAVPQFYMAINGRPYGGARVIELQGDEYVATGGDPVAAADTSGMSGMGDMDTGMASSIVPTTKVGDHVRWRALNLSADDPHTFHLHGHHWCPVGLPGEDGLCANGAAFVDNQDLLPAQGVSLEYIEDAPGDWMYHCHVEDHMVDGMWAMMHVEP